MSAAEHPFNMMEFAARLMREGATRQIRQMASVGYDHALAASLGTHSPGGVSESMKLAQEQLGNAARLHSAKLEEAGATPDPELLDAAYVQPTQHHDNWVAETNEGLKNGR